MTLCPRCNTQSVVIESRRYQCANNHKFTVNYETNQPVRQAAGTPSQHLQQRPDVHIESAAAWWSGLAR